MSTQTLNLFDDLVADAPQTEGIKYAGSKLKLLPHILQLVQKVKPRTVLDGFSGSTRVAQALAQTGYRVVANDRVRSYLGARFDRDIVPDNDWWDNTSEGIDVAALPRPKGRR